MAGELSRGLEYEGAEQGLGAEAVAPANRAAAGGEVRTPGLGGGGQADREISHQVAAARDELERMKRGAA